jgi:type VI protein secretion system component VasF
MPDIADWLVETDASSDLHPARTARIIKRYSVRIYLPLYLIYTNVTSTLIVAFIKFKYKLYKFNCIIMKLYFNKIIRGSDK